MVVIAATRQSDAEEVAAIAKDLDHSGSFLKVVGVMILVLVVR